MKKSSLAVLGLVLVFALAACSASEDSEKKEQNIKNAQTNAVTNATNQREYKKGAPICPQVAIIHELELVRDYGGEKPDPSQLVGEARFMGIQGSCDYQDDGIDITFTADMAAGRGPRLGGDHVGFPFFVAVVDPKQDILNKDQMTANFRFEEDKKIVMHNEPLHVFIPLAKKDDASGPDYQVLVGFQLTEAQLNDVRAKEAQETKPAAAR